MLTNSGKCSDLLIKAHFILEHEFYFAISGYISMLMNENTSYVLTPISSEVNRNGNYLTSLLNYI